MSFEQNNHEEPINPFDFWFGRKDAWRPLQGAHVRHNEHPDRTFLVSSDGLVEVGTGFVHSYPTSANGFQVVSLFEPSF